MSQSDMKNLDACSRKLGQQRSVLARADWRSRHRMFFVMICIAKQFATICAGVEIEISCLSNTQRPRAPLAVTLTNQCISA